MQISRLGPAARAQVEAKLSGKPVTARRDFALGRIAPGTMNKTEAAYARHLDDQKAAGEVLWWKFEAFKLRIAAGCFLDVDFAVMTADCALQMHDVKGSLRIITDDAKVKMKVAASLYPFQFFYAVRVKGEWTLTEVAA